jgi:hypothetical protein
MPKDGANGGGHASSQSKSPSSPVLVHEPMRRLYLSHLKQYARRVEQKCTEATQRGSVDVIFALNQSIP